MFLPAGETRIDTRMAWRTNSSKSRPGAGVWPRAQLVALGTARSPQGRQEQRLPWGDSDRAPRLLPAKWCLPSGKSLQTSSSNHRDPGTPSAEIKVTERSQVKVGSANK